MSGFELGLSIVTYELVVFNPDSPLMHKNAL